MTVRTGRAFMASHESLRRIRKEDYAPRRSLYLAHGYRDDEFELTNVMIGESVVIGSVKVNRFFPPMDGEFHLAAHMAMIWVSQLATVYSFCELDVPEKDRETLSQAFFDQVPKTHRRTRQDFPGVGGHVQSGTGRQDPLSRELRRGCRQLHRRGGLVHVESAVDRERMTGRAPPSCRRTPAPRNRAGGPMLPKRSPQATA